MDAQRHALLAGRLIEACGGLIEAAASCRLEKSQLHRFTDPEAGQFMPADVMAQLEARAGAPLYSLAMAELQAPIGAVEDIRTEAERLTEEAAATQRLVREATEDGKLTPRERREIRRQVLRLREQIAELDAATDGDPS
ncbi:MAG: hypothetical protein ACOYXW_11190 [Actinomycetota bacterium]